MNVLTKEVKLESHRRSVKCKTHFRDSAKLRKTKDLAFSSRSPDACKTTTNALCQKARSLDY